MDECKPLILGKQDLPIDDDARTSAKPTCSLVRQVRHPAIHITDLKP